ncbi:MAG: penicillin-binding protein, partial [Acidithiobacillus sp.]
MIRRWSGWLMNSVAQGGAWFWPRGGYRWWRRAGRWLLTGIVVLAIAAWFMPPSLKTLTQEGRIIYDRHGHVLALFLNKQQQWAFTTSPQRVSPV